MSHLHDQSAGARWMRFFLPTGIGARLFLLIATGLVPLSLLLGWIYYDRYQTRQTQALQTELAFVVRLH